MRQAFHALKHTGSNAITFQDWKLLVNRIRPNYSKARVLLLWRVLDDNDNGNVTEREFLKAADVLNVNLQMSTSGKNVWTKHCPKLYATTGSMMIRKLVQSHYLSYFVNVAIIINVIVIATDDVDGQTTKKADYVFLTVFIVEILLKNWTYGIRNYFRSGWNQFDFTIVALYLFVLFVEGVTNLSESASNAMLELLMIFRVLRLVKIIGLTDRFRVIVDTIWHVRTAISMYGKILLVVYYVFAIIGMYCFAGKIYEGNRTLEGSTFEEGSPFYIDLHAGNPELEGSEFAADGYYANNFNDPISAFVTLFELQVVNQWHVQTEGFVLLTHKSARIYFVIFNLITVVLIMNIFISFVIEAFVLQLQFEASPTESTVERKIDAEIEKSPSLKAEFDRLTVAKKTAKTEEFLVRMFEAEILPTLNAIAGDDPFRPPSRVTSNGSDTLEEPNRLPGITSDTMRERHATQWGGGPEPTESATPSNGSIELPILGRNAEPAGDGSAA
jgi:two pore calcium channel protein 3